MLIVGSTRQGALETAYSDALRRLGVPVVDHFDIDRAVIMLSGSRVVRRLTESIQCELTGHALAQYLRGTLTPYEVVVVFKGMLLTPRWLARCKSLTPTATWANLNPDDPFNAESRGASNTNVLNAISSYDIYITWTKDLIPAIQAAGCNNILVLPFGYDPRRHFPAHTDISELAKTVTFVGTWDRDRERLLSQVADLPLRIFGWGWDRVAHGSLLSDKISPGNLYGEALRQVVSSSMASINILRPQNATSHNMRTFEIPAMRGLMLTTYSEEQNSFFPNGGACAMYRDAHELRILFGTLVTGRCDIDKVKAAALKHCAGNTYDNRAATLVSAVQSYWDIGYVK